MNILLNILNFLFVVGLVVVVFNILIVVHELGHFLAARWRGLVVEKFAVWFGKPLWKRKIGGVEYILGSIPAGGYVALPQLSPMEAMEGRSELSAEELPPISALDKIIVALAGPLFSFGLALVFAVVVWLVGRPVDEVTASTRVGFVSPASPAYAAGLRSGDVIKRIDDYPVKRLAGMGDSVHWRFIRSEGDAIKVDVERNGTALTLHLPPEKEQKRAWERTPLRVVPFLPDVRTKEVNSVLKGSPADWAGLKKGDELVGMNGRPVETVWEVNDYVRRHPDEPVTLTMQRDGKTFDVTLKAAVPIQYPGEEAPALLGIGWSTGGKEKLIYPDPFTQIMDSVYVVVNTLEAVLSPRSSVNATHLSGPVGILNLYSILFQSPDGWRRILWLSVVINVNLALVNLLPIPVLDGGHITMAILEAIRRKPLDVRVLEVLNSACALALIAFLLLVTFYDGQDVVRRFQSTEIVFAPPASANTASPP